MKKYLFISVLIFGCQTSDIDQIEPILELPKIVIETEGFKEIDSKERSRKIYALPNQIFFDIITLKELLTKKPEGMSDKEFLGEVLRFN